MDDKKPGWLKTDFDRWRSEDDSEEEMQEEITVRIIELLPPLPQNVYLHVPFHAHYLKIMVPYMAFPQIKLQRTLWLTRLVICRLYVTFLFNQLLIEQLCCNKVVCQVVTPSLYLVIA